MLAVEKWAQGKPPLLAMFAIQIAAFSRVVPEILKYQKKHRLLAHTFQVPDLHYWYSLYNSYQRYIGPFLEMVSQTATYGQEIVSLFSVLQDLPRHLEQDQMEDISPEQAKAGQNYLNELLRMSLTDFQEEIDDVPFAPEVIEKAQQYKDSNGTELAFLFLVAIPCWFIYKEFPSTLYNKAICGDFNAMHNLLRLDPFTLHDPAIGNQIQLVRIHGRQSLYEELLNAPTKPLKIKLTNRMIKDMLAGLISLIADALDHPLTSTGIRDLFDAVAKDADKRDIDTSLPESQEAYLKVIQRNRPEWKPLLEPGQKKVK